MPELPEVETVRRGLEPVWTGRRLTEVEVRRPDLRAPFPPRFADRLAGARIETLTRRGKYIVAALDQGEALVIHLGMSGRITIEAGGDAVEPGAFTHTAVTNPAHDHVVFHTDDGARVTFNDPRRFGSMHLDTPGALDATGPFKAMGPEPLSNAFNGPALSAALEGKRTPIKAALLDQRVVAGLGNIYVCEALFRAGISPRRLASSVAGARAERLAPIIQDVLRDAIEAGGSTLRDYAHTDGSLGYFQHRFDVYGREGEACTTCGATVRRIVQSGRSTFYCGRCQR